MRIEPISVLDLFWKFVLKNKVHASIVIFQYHGPWYTSFVQLPEIGSNSEDSMALQKMAIEWVNC